VATIGTQKLGSDGPAITRLGFGAWAAGGSGTIGLGKVDDNESIRAIRRAIEGGVNWVDSAPAYGDGHSEITVARAIKPYRAGEHVFLFTKCGQRWDGAHFEHDGRPSSLKAECEASLRRLNIDNLDLLQIHWPDWQTGTPVEESWRALAELVDAGKVRWIGASNFDISLLERCEAIRHVDAVQPPLSLLRRGARRELIPWCERNGTGVIAYSPLSTGLLTGTFDRARILSLPADDFRRRVVHDFREPELTRALHLVAELQTFAAKLGTSVTALSVAWVLAVPGVTGAIVGARRASQVEEWLPAAGLALDDDTMAGIDRIIRETRAGSDDPPPTRPGS
jgi:aryl-alcohol dehydrogenase-like predicted oxidoreductase